MNTRTKNMLYVQPILTILVSVVGHLRRMYPAATAMTFTLQGALLALAGAYLILVIRANLREGLTFKGNPRNSAE